METPRYNIQDIGERVDQILSILQGNDLDEQDYGMIGDVRRLKMEIYELKQWRKVKEKTYYIWISVAAGLSSFVTWVLSMLLSK